MNTREFVANLDYDQLKFAKKCIEETIQKKEDEVKVGLWVISDDMINHGAFLESDYDRAVSFLKYVIDDTNRPDDNRQVYHLDKVKYFKDEVKDMLALAGNDWESSYV